MKFISKILIAAFLVAAVSCNNSKEPSTEENTLETGQPEEALPQVDEVFPEWYAHLTATDSSFSIEGFDGGQTDIRSDSADHSIRNQVIARYMPFLIFNSDSSYAIDLVTHNFEVIERGDEVRLTAGGPDLEVGLINLRNNTRKRLLFFGTMGTVMDARWTDKNTLMIAGYNESEGDSIRPVVWKYEVPSRAWYVYTYDRMIAASPGFNRKWLNGQQ